MFYRIIQTMRKISFAFEGRMANRAAFRAVFAILALALPITAGAQQQSAPPLLDAMTTELHRAFTSLGKQGDAKQLPPYFLSYSVSDATVTVIQAQYGALVNSASNHLRVADVQVRLGEPKLDNTHGGHRGSAVNSATLPLADDREALARSLWLATNAGYGKALENYLQVKTEAEVRAKEEDSSPDFSQEAPQVYLGKPAPPVKIDRLGAAHSGALARLPRLSRCESEYGDARGAE
jgi:hypothetical protein